MKKSLANKIAKHWNENFAGSTDATKTVAVAEDDNVYICPTADNDGWCFYHVEEFADMIRTFRVDGLISCREGKCIARLF